MIKTCCHELAHYLQYLKHDGKSNCESDLVLNREYDKELIREHKELRKEIYQLIKNSGEY